MLRIDFYESGNGETIVITFPSGGLGIVDAHSSPSGSRPSIKEITQGHKIHFVCLSHPHADHGEGLIPVLASHPDIGSFWHTVSDIEQFFFLLQEVDNYPSPFREVVLHMKKKWAEFLIDIFGSVAERNIPLHRLRNDLRPDVIDGVEVHCLSPNESMSYRFIKAYRVRMEGKQREMPDCNLLSAVLALRYGNSVIVLGADALKENWHDAVSSFHKNKLPKAIVFKVPHHGAANALTTNPQKKQYSYFDVCSRNPKAVSVLFAGDAKHPDSDVFKRLKKQTNLICVANGLADKPNNPLHINIPGARLVSPSHVCNAVVSYEIDDRGNAMRINGKCCGWCQSDTTDALNIGNSMSI